MSTTTATVSAPSDLPGGYELDVDINGQSQTVIVPDGGVKEGQEFTGSVKATPVVMGDPEKETEKNVMQIPTGAWREDFFGCFKYVSKCIFWSSWCCTPITFGQVLDRNGFDWMVNTVPEGAESNAFMVYLLSFIFILIIGLWAVIFGVLYHVFIVIMIMKLRPILRRKYQIEGGTPLCDCCAAFWCQCCTIMQMNTHTAEFDKYDSKFCTKDGLAPDAPQVPTEVV
jgi:Cys-rich protein (TIGR01571 family)